MTELELEREVRRLLAEHGLMNRAFHIPDSRGMARGLPDWIIIGRRRIVWRELKSPYGAMSRAQWDIGDALLQADQDWKVWRPHHLHAGEIARELDELVQL